MSASADGDPPGRGRAAARPLRSGTGGFTLLEAVVALLVVGLAVAGALGAASRTLSSQAEATRHAEALALAESRLRELRIRSADTLARLTQPRWHRRRVDGRSYRQRSRARRDGTSEDLWHVTTEVRWDGGRVELSTILHLPPAAGGSASVR